MARRKCLNKGCGAELGFNEFIGTNQLGYEGKLYRCSNCKQAWLFTDSPQGQIPIDI